MSYSRIALLVPIFLCMMLIHLAPVHAQVQTKRKEYGMGVNQYRIEFYNEALQHLKKARKRDRNNALIHYYKAHSWMFLGEMKKAERDFKRCVRLTPDNAEYYNAIGYFYNQSGRYHKAIEMLSFAISLDPKYSEAYNNRGVSYHRLSYYTNPEEEHFSKAFENFDMAIALDSTFALAYNNRGTARYFNQHIAEPTERDVLEAVADFNQALRYDPFLSTVYRNRAMAFSYLKKYDLAVKEIRTAIHYNPEDALNYLNRARIMVSMDRKYDAIDNFELALSKDSSLVDAYLELAEVFHGMDLLEKALRTQKRILKANQAEQSRIHYNIAVTFALKKDLLNTIANLKKALKLGYFNKKTYLNFLKDPRMHRMRREEEFRNISNKINNKVFR